MSKTEFQEKINALLSDLEALTEKHRPPIDTPLDQKHGRTLFGSYIIIETLTQILKNPKEWERVEIMAIGAGQAAGKLPIREKQLINPKMINKMEKRKANWQKSKRQ